MSGSTGFFTKNNKNGTFILTITLYRCVYHLSIASDLQSEGQNTEATPARGSAVARSLDILQLVATAERPLTPAEMGEKLGIPKATVHRLCAGLEERGLVESRINGRGLLPGREMYRMSLGVLGSSAFKVQRHAVLSSLSERIGETCNISVPEGSTMLYFDRVETHWPVRIQLPIGSRVPLHCTSAGKMYLSTLPGVKQRQVLESLNLKRYTQKTVTDVDTLMAELAATAERGYAQDDEEWLEGMVALAVPLSDPAGRVYATLSFNAPAMRTSLAESHQYLDALRSAAAELDEISNTN